MPQDPAAALGALLRGVSIDDHDEVLKAANAALRSKKDDPTALHTRVVALLNLDRFDDALRSIDEGGAALDAACRPEKAYALYKLGRLDEATELLAGTDDDVSSQAARGRAHLAAQVAYRAERFAQADALYRKLRAAEESTDIDINLRAVAAQAAWNGPATTAGEDASQPHQLDTFELCYNEACSAIARGQLDQAEILLRRAETLCDASDDLTDEDKQAEMQPILSQKAYIQARLGKTDEALNLYKTLGKSGSNDPDLDLIIENNRIALDSASANPYLVQRQVSSWPNRAKAAKLFSHQADAVRRNGLLVDLRANKVRGVVERTAKAVAAEDQPSTRAGINALSGLNAVAATHGKSGNELLHALQDLSRKRPTDVGLALTLVQTHLDRGSAGAALSTFEAFLGRLEQPAEDCSAAPRHALDTRFSPGIVALAASLMRSQGRHSSSKTELSKAVRYWQQERPASVSESSETESTSWARPLLQEAGIELLRSSNPRDLKLAGSAFEKLFSESQGSHIAAAGLVASLAPFDLEKADEYVAELPEVDDLIDDVDVDALLDAGVATYISPAAQAAGAKRAAADDDARTSKTAAGPAKKRRTRKLPKNYVEGRTPDPERWLPLRDRSSYRPKGRKGKKKAAESTQGGPVRDEETLGLVGGGGVKVEKAGGNANKKKKKGKK